MNTPFFRIDARKTLARLGLGLLSLTLSCFVAECVYRRHLRLDPSGEDPAWRQRIRRMNSTIYRRSEAPGVVYEPLPGASLRMPYGTAGFNLGAMRDDREHPLAATEGTRVAILGDSVVWGEEVSLEDSLPRALERALDPNGSYEVLGFGVSGYDTAQEAWWYGHAVRRYRPRTVVLVYCLNDAMLMSGPYNRFATPDEAAVKDAQDALWERLAPSRAETLEARTELRVLRSSFRMATALQGWSAARAYARSPEYTDEYILSHGRPERASRVRLALVRLGEALRRDGALPHLVISPVLRSWDHYPWRGIHALVGGFGRAAGFTVHDPLETWMLRESAERMRLPGDALHYNPHGTRVLGSYIAEALLRSTN